MENGNKNALWYSVVTKVCLCIGNGANLLLISHILLWRQCLTRYGCLERTMPLTWRNQLSPCLHFHISIDYAFLMVMSVGALQ